jgi:hypothetical protein
MLLRTSAVTVGIALTFSLAARADPVNIVTSGFYSMAFDEISDFRFLGTGFDIEGMANGGSRPVFACRPCRVVTALDASDNFDSEVDLGVPAIFGVRSFPVAFYNGGMVFDTGRVIVPDVPMPPLGGGFHQKTLLVPLVASGFLV